MNRDGCKFLNQSSPRGGRCTRGCFGPAAPLRSRPAARCVPRLPKQGHKDIVLNLSGLQYLDSSGIGRLARVYVSVVKQSGQMKVVGLSSKVEEILKITHLYQVFPEFPDEEAALKSFPENRPKR